MPCYMVQTVSVEFKASNAELLRKALEALDWKVCSWTNNQVIVQPKNSYQSLTLNLGVGKAQIQSSQQSQLNELKRAYSLQALTMASQGKGWGLLMQHTTTGTKGRLVRSYL